MMKKRQLASERFAFKHFHQPSVGFLPDSGSAAKSTCNAPNISAAQPRTDMLFGSIQHSGMVSIDPYKNRAHLPRADRAVVNQAR